MRIPKYISPSQISLWDRDREGYYLQHLAEARSPRMVQTQAMSIGSAFDAYVKAELYALIFGAGTNTEFEFDTIFETQVSKENWDWGRENGKYMFECYKDCGAFDDLMDLVEDCQHKPQFEFSVSGEVGKVPLLGKPDMRFVHKDGAHIILDWKVSGYCSKHGASPAKNYQLVRDCWDGDPKPSRTNGQAHKGYEEIIWHGIPINENPLEHANKTWAEQLAIYGWLLGEPVGSEDVIVCIDQIVAKPTNGLPLLRVANQRSRISPKFQHDLMHKITNCWKAIQDDYIFDDVSKEESQARCEILERRAEAAACKNVGLPALHAYMEEQSKIYKF